MIIYFTNILICNFFAADQVWQKRKRMNLIFGSGLLQCPERRANLPLLIFAFYVGRLRLEASICRLQPRFSIAYREPKKKN